MKKGMISIGPTMLKIGYDPLDGFKGLEAIQLLEYAGMLLYWAAEANVHGGIKEALIANYPYYGGPMEGGEIAENGGYNYPGDPVLKPVFKAQVQGCADVAYFYEYGMVGVVNEAGEQWVARMD